MGPYGPQLYGYPYRCHIVKIGVILTGDRRDSWNNLRELFSGPFIATRSRYQESVGAGVRTAISPLNA